MAGILEVNAQGDWHEKKRIGVSGRAQRLDDRGVVGFDLDHEDVQADPGLEVGRTAGAHEDVLCVLAVDGDPSVDRQVDERPGVSQKTHFHAEGRRKNFEGGLPRLAWKIQKTDFQSQAEIGGEPSVDLQSSPVAVSDQVGDVDLTGGRGESQRIVKGGISPDAENGHSDARERDDRLIRFGWTGVGKEVPDRVPPRFEVVEGIADVAVRSGDRWFEGIRSQEAKKGDRDSPFFNRPFERHVFP